MAAGELPVVGQPVSHAEAAEHADDARDEPATARARRDDVLDRQQDHGGSLTRLEQRHHESEVRRRARRARGETDRLDSREHEHHHEDAANAPKGRDETDEEYESIERQRRQEAVAYEEPGRLVPAR